MKASKTKVAAVIEGFLLGTADPLDWGDFISTEIENDPALDKIRLMCFNLPDLFPPKPGDGYCGAEGITFLQKLVEELKKG